MSQRGELLLRLSKRKISGDTRLLCSGAIKDHSDQEKEEIAVRILSILNESADEKSFIEGLRKANFIK